MQFPRNPFQTDERYPAHARQTAKTIFLRKGETWASRYVDATEDINHTNFIKVGLSRIQVGMIRT